MGKFQSRTPREHHKPHFYLVVNRAAADYSEKKISFLSEAVAQSGAECRLIQPESPREAAGQIRRALNSRPEAVIACGGDSTVNLVAQHLIRRLPILGILPLGRINNIYRSLYGEPNIKDATGLILSRQNRRIDHGLVCDQFFMGSVGIGLIPELAALIEKKGLPRLGLSWSRVAALAAAAVEPGQYSIKMDAFRFDFAPLMININLLSYSVGLPLAPTALDDDGCGEVTFDIGQGKPIISGYIRQIYKRKYLYADEIRMFRGARIAVSPVKGRKIYIDGEITTCPRDVLDIEIFEKKIRVFQKNRE